MTEKIKRYDDYIANILDSVRKSMDELKELVKGLDSAIVGQLLINLRYLTKRISFKKEQECRIVKFSLKEKDTAGEEVEQKYIEYTPEVSKHIEKIVFGPKATGMEQFQDTLTHKNIYVKCEQSEHRLA